MFRTNCCLPLLLLFLSHKTKCLLAVDYRSHIKLYKTLNCQGSSFEAHYNVPNFDYPEWDNTLYSAKMLGIWITYEDEQYNEKEDNLVEYVYSNAFDQCIQFRWTGGRVSSFQYAGNYGDYRKNTLTIYERNYFQGSPDNVALFEEDTSNFYMKSGSLVITGVIPWELWQYPDYQGKSFCVIPPPSDNSAPFVLVDFKDLDIPYNFPQSVTLGCEEVEPSGERK